MGIKRDPEHWNFIKDLFIRSEMFRSGEIYFDGCKFNDTHAVIKAGSDSGFNSFSVIVDEEELVDILQDYLFLLAEREDNES